MQQTCANGWCKQSFDVTDADLAFYDKVSPVFGGKKYAIPPPTRCPECRFQRRLASINQITVYTRPSSVSGKYMFSMFSEKVPFAVYENEYWWSNAWNELESGRIPDPQRAMFPQLNELQAATPHFALMTLKNVNCDFCNNASENKHCYLCFNTRRSEDCLCCERSVGSTNCTDCTDVAACELCYQCTACTHCYNTQESQECMECTDGLYLLNCRSCHSCFSCVNLRHAKYCIFNKQCTKEAYEEFLKEMTLSSYAQRKELERKALEFWQQQPRPHATMNMTENVSGNYIFQSKNVRDSYLVRNGEDLRFCSFAFDGVKDCYDFTAYGDQVEQTYEIARCGNRFSRSAFCYYCYDGCSDLFYCNFCVGCQDCFGCNGLRKKRYCIMNTQYTKEKYETTVPILIEQMRSSGEWGEFFPMTDSPFPYNHSMAQRYFPVSRSDAATQKLLWHEQKLAQSGQAIDPSVLPDKLPASDEPIITRSAVSGKAFKITGEEVKHRRRFSAPLPRESYDERMEERAKNLGGVHLYERMCAKTGKPILTTFPPASPWIIWDKDIYDQEFGG